LDGYRQSAGEGFRGSKVSGVRPEKIGLRTEC
jgi:hypothetical protein